MASLEASYQLRPGDKLGRYQLLVPVGAGGMGRVWAARRTGSMPAKQLVAIKTGLGEVGGSPEFERLFMDEARIASMIEHPNVCGIYELGEEQGVLYLVMEWSDGATLRDVLDASPERRLEYGLAARIVASVCAGLHAAHELEDIDGTSLHVVHRDVSPQNILIASAGHVKVADFGVAKARGQLHRPTETGEMKGKLSYMAPEQVTSKDFDRRADIFALGCVLYEATLGRRPYQGGDALSTLYQLLERDIEKPSVSDPSFPPELEAIVVKALAKDAAERFQSASDMEHALESWLASSHTIVTESKIAELMQATCGELIDTKRRMVRDTIHKLESNQPIDANDVSLNGPSTNEPTVRPVDGDAQDSEQGSQPTELVQAEMGSRRWRLATWVAVGAAGGLSAVLLVAALLGPRDLGNSSEPTRVATAVSPSIPPQSLGAEASSQVPRSQDRVSITIRTSPTNAELVMDDGRPLPNPFVERVLKDRVSHELRATASGHETVSRTVVFDRDQELLLELEPLKTSSGRGAQPVGIGKTPTPREVDHSPAVDSGARQPGEALGKRRTGMQPRDLDSENPFANQKPPTGERLGPGANPNTVTSPKPSGS